jgi:hypothetical protein
LLRVPIKLIDHALTADEATLPTRPPGFKIDRA